MHDLHNLFNRDDLVGASIQGGANDSKGTMTHHILHVEFNRYPKVFVQYYRTRKGKRSIREDEAKTKSRKDTIPKKTKSYIDTDT